VIVGAEGGNRWTGGIGRSLRAVLLSPFVRQSLRMFIARTTAEDLQYLKELIEAGQVTPVIDRTYPLSQVPEAMRHLEQEHAQGKVVIVV
jgi:NADPH:quinone reductase-like Zn-dependent oxidoreductase